MSNGAMECDAHLLRRCRIDGTLQIGHDRVSPQSNLLPKDDDAVAV